MAFPGSCGFGPGAACATQFKEHEMKIAKTLLVAPLAGLALANTAAAGLADVPAGTYKLESTHGYINFSYTHLGFSRPIVGFNSFDVTLELDKDDVSASSLEVDIDAASIDSRIEVFNGHLKSADWFNVEAHPDITFVATDIEMTGDDTMTVTGDLTIMGITKPVTLDATINKAGTHPFNKKPTIGVSATGTLLRSDWNLGKYAPAVTDEVELNIQVELNTEAAG